MGLPGYMGGVAKVPDDLRPSCVVLLTCFPTMALQNQYVNIYITQANLDYKNYIHPWLLSHNSTVVNVPS